MSLNPQSENGGLKSKEEVEIIRPAIEEAKHFRRSPPQKDRIASN
ncbi:MAG: 4-hydroxythreonine-4-phosphate dehydrogenase PdxA [Prevotellaceae bacterium]|nr:4-hydroxythreonine-4-phosphate dehydrogenase PdxA [Prevotellaceae bacterium]